MFPQRKLLYQRGIDESVGTYVTDYILTFECFSFVLILLYVRFVKYKDLLSRENANNKSIWSTLVILFSVGIAALIGGLTHQFLGAVEPYSGPHDALYWVILWRFAAAFSGIVAMSFFVLAEYLVTSEGLMMPRRYAIYGYYTFATLFSLALIVHSFWMITNKTDPWSLTFTFIIVFVAAFWELVVSLVVLYKRFRTPATAMNDSYEFVQKSYNTDSSIETSVTKNHMQLQSQNSLEPLNNNEKVSLVRRWDLLMYCVASSCFIIGGAVQLILAKFFNCGNNTDPASQGCPLPNSFNHNSVFHIFQLFAMLWYFVAELLAVNHRKSMAEKTVINA